MGYFAGDLADGCKTLGLGELTFDISLSGHILDDYHCAADLLGRCSPQRCADNVQKLLSPVKIVPYRSEITVAACRDGRFEQLRPVAPDFGIGAGGKGAVDILSEVDERSGLAVCPDYPQGSVASYDSGTQRFDYGAS